jgi:hypothetical protein
MRVLFETKKSPLFNIALCTVPFVASLLAQIAVGRRISVNGRLTREDGSRLCKLQLDLVWVSLLVCEQFKPVIDLFDEI